MTFRPLDTHVPLSAFNYVHLSLKRLESLFAKEDVALMPLVHLYAIDLNDGLHFMFYFVVCLICGVASQSTAMVMSGRWLHFTCMGRLH